MPSPDHEIILRDIAEVEQTIAGLRTRQQEAATKLRSLQKRLEQTNTGTTEKPASSATNHAARIPTLNAEDKISVFMRLFRGREDVYPRLWENHRKGTKGYSPACANEWIRGVCEKPRVKCGECPNQAFLPVTTDTVRAHLQGHHVIGVYAMLLDETCWFLAADFDKAAWKDDIIAFAQTCRNAHIPYAIERSRSGNGGHVWFFFNAPVPAVTARKMGSYLLTKTMANRYQLSMASYDRLFPNQDTLPSGGFGNLIALPLQYRSRQDGNTVFLDDDLKPLPDQWGFLNTLSRLSPAEVERIAAEASNRGEVIGIQTPDTGEDEGDDKPWLRIPSREPPGIHIIEPIPTVVRAVLSQRLYVEKAGLPSPLINQIKRLAAFQNPDFYKKQGLRLSTALTPRVIYCAEDHDKHMGLPRACVTEVQSLLGKHQSRLEIEDQRTSGIAVNVRFLGELTDIQRQAVSAIAAHDNGVIVAPPGFGKTVLGTYLIAERQCSTLILVHRQPLLKQRKLQIGAFLGLDAKSIGQKGGGKKRLTGEIDVAMIQSLFRKDSVDSIVANYGQVIVDECHHLAAVSFERVLSEVKARYVIGLTATPKRRDGHQPIVHMQLGPVRFSVDPRSQLTQRPFVHLLVVRETGFRLPFDRANISIQPLYGLLATDEKRNERIINDVIAAMEEGRSPILLTERKDHVDLLHQRLRGVTSQPEPGKPTRPI